MLDFISRINSARIKTAVYPEMCWFVCLCGLYYLTNTFSNLMLARTGFGTSQKNIIVYRKAYPQQKSPLEEFMASVVTFHKSSVRKGT